MANDNEEDVRDNQPGLGMAFLVVLTMLGMSAILFALIYALMVAISPIEKRGTGTVTEVVQPVPQVIDT
jgi:hypothetical protein